MYSQSSFGLAGVGAADRHERDVGGGVSKRRDPLPESQPTRRLTMRLSRITLLTLASLTVACASEGPATPRPPFDPSVHGFGFQNYTNEASPVNLTGAEMQRMCGDAVCARGTGPTCTLSPPVQQGMEQLNALMNGGHCEGMAVLSGRMYLGQQQASTYGADTPFGLRFDGNAALQREIAYWFALQLFPPVSSARLRGTPTEQVERLRASFASSGDRYTIGFWKRDRTGGHAVLPYEIREEGATTRIMVYDNNFPGEARAIEIDTAANTWRYVAAASPDVAAALYEGDATTNTLVLVPLSVRTQPIECPTGNVQMGGTRTVSTVGSAGVLITDDAGRRMGHMGDMLLEEIPGGDVVELTSDDLWADRAEPIYRVPGGGDLMVTLTADDGAPTPGGLSVSGPGYYLGVENVMLEPGQVDELVLGGGAPFLSYETGGMETPDVVIAIQTEGADWTIILRSRGDSAGQAIAAEVAPADGFLYASFGGADATSEFDLDIVRTDESGDLEFSHANVSVPNGAQLTLDYGAFDVDGEMLVLEVDLDGDGTPDETIDLLDEP